MNDKLKSINSEPKKHSNKYHQFVTNTRDAVRKTLATVGMTVSSILPTSVNNIFTIFPLASTTATTITIGTTTSLLTACSNNDGPEEIKDTTPPTIDILKPEVDVTGGKEIQIIGNQLYIGGTIVASRSDDISKECKVYITINGGGFKSGDIVVNEGTLTLKVSDQAGNIKTAEIKLKLTNEEQSPISGLEALKNSSLQVDQETDLLKGISFAYGIRLIKTEIQINGQRSIIEDPNHYTPEYPGTCNIILTVKDKDNKVTEYNVENLTIKPLDYRAMEVTNIKPVEILPIIGQVEGGDKQCYEHIEHLRVAEATRIRDMMREYGAGNYNAEEYKQLMNRLNTGMIGESPRGYNNYESVGTLGNTTSYHAHDERNILNTLIDHANFKVVNSTENDDEVLYNFIKDNEISINIFGQSMSREGQKEGYLNVEGTDIKKKLLKLKNFILFGAGTNIKTGRNGILKNKIYQENVNTNDEHGVYGMPSTANGKNDSNIDRHLLVTIGTNANGNIDQTNEEGGSSKFPVGFHNKILFSGHSFPYLSGSSNKIIGEAGKYATSYTNYVNVAMADLCFQMKADVSDVNELLEMIRSTSLTDHIKFNGENQPLQLINPAGFFKKYLMPNNLPSSVQTSETASLNKGYYNGVIFDIPGAEVKINGQWVAYNDDNKSQIKGQNPINLEWRINGDLCRKLGYEGKNINGKIIVLDDRWNGLNIDKDFSINIQ